MIDKTIKNKYNWINIFTIEITIMIGILLTLFAIFLDKFKEKIYLFVLDSNNSYIFEIFIIFILCCGIIYLLFYYIKIKKYKKLLLKLPLNDSELKELKLNSDYEIVNFYIKILKASHITQKPIFLNSSQKKKIKEILEFHLTKIVEKELEIELERKNIFRKLYCKTKFNNKIILSNKSYKYFMLESEAKFLPGLYVIELNENIKLFYSHVETSYIFYIKINKL